MKSVNRIIALLLALVLLTLSLVSCSSKGKALLKLENEKISVNIFELYLSRMKGTLCSAASFGNSATKDEFWDTWMDIYDKKTYNTHYTQMVLESAKTYLAALALFDQRGLKLPQSEIDKIDEELKSLLDNEANGSKTAFNAIIGEYGVNYEMLREAYIIEAKIAYLQNDLFGADGSKIGENLIEEYYQENYARFKQIFLYTYEYQYVTDRNGDVMYYKENGKISYDTSKTPKLNDNGEHVVDENGDKVYVYIDDEGQERIAYDTQNGKSEVLVDDDGNAVIKDYNDTEMEVIIAQRDEILAQTKAGDMPGFDVLRAKYNEDEGADEYPDGYYITKDTNYESPEVIEKLFNMDIGEVDWVKSDYGIHIIMRCPLEKGVYATDAYKNLFISNKTGTYIFMDALKAELMTEYLAPYKEKITVDEKLLSTVDIKRAGVNFYY